jgi:hypothetical protein
MFAGCVYYNTLYNAEDLYREAENLRLNGQDSAVSARYKEVIAKATEGYRSDEQGGWADDALLLVAKAQFRLGANAEASRALERVLEISGDADVRAQAALYQGVIAIAEGETALGTQLLDRAMEDVQEPSDRAEGHLWLARGFFERGMAPEGWRELDEAANTSSAYFVVANLERIAWGFALPDLTRIHQGIQALIFTSRAEVHGDSIRSLAQRFSERWGAGSADVLLANAEDARWSREERDRLLMKRAGFAHEAGDLAQAEQDASRVASGVGDQAAAARVKLARWRLAEVRQVDELAQLRSVLLPAVTYDEAQALLNAMRRLELLTEYALEGEPVALIGAAEIARDVLGAGQLSAGLFQAYAAFAPNGRWTGKALLASRALTTDPVAWKQLDRRLEALAPDAYVRYAQKGHGEAELGELESGLQEALDPLVARVDEELEARRQLAGLPKK